MKTNYYLVTVSFFESFFAYLKLYRAGFRISTSERPDLDWAMYRFYWNGYIIRETCDIDRTGSVFSTMRNGHAEQLPMVPPKPNLFTKIRLCLMMNYTIKDIFKLLLKGE